MSSRYSISTNRLEYASEVAYIVATSPPSASAGAIGGLSDDEFEFSLEGLGLGESTQGRGGGGVSTKAAEDKETEESRREDGGRVRQKAKPKFPAEETDFATDVAASPGEASLQELQKMVVIYGPTGYANRQLVSKLVQSNPSIFTLVVPHTSRKRAQSEINGIDFHFVDRKEMSSQIRKDNFIECVKISSPNLKSRKASVSSTPASASTTSASPAEQTPVSPVSSTPASATLVNPWSNIVQVPSPLLTPKSRQRARKSNKSCELFGTSKEAIHKARLLGKPCIVLSVTHKGAEQLKKAGYEAVYILLDVGGDGSEQTDTAETSEHSLQPDHTITAGNTEQAFSELQQHAFHTVSSLTLSPRSKFDITRDEWENLPTVEMDQQPSEASSPISKVRLLTFNNLLVHYQRERIGSRPAKTKKVPTLAKGLRNECNLVLSLSEMQLSDTDTDLIHIGALQTIYQKLMGSALNCRRYGPHWQDIGFPGVDPAENLREVGFFGIMQLIYLLDRSLPLTLEMFTYSREGTYQFPFAIVSINLTQIALNSLRDGCLTKLCNKHDQVFITLNEYYMAMFHRFFLLWKSQRQSSSSSQMGPVIRDVEGYAKRHPKNVIADLLAYLDSGKDKHEKIAIRKISHSLSNPFTPFDKLAEEQELQTTLPSTSPT